MTIITPASKQVSLKLSASGLSLAPLGPDLAVPFTLRALRRPRVAWRNERWFLEQGLDILNPDVVAHIDAWLLREFAWHAEASPQDADYASAKVGHADRYGGSRGTIHGGSGRCALLGNFIAKGVGRTPLVGVGAEASHSDGALPLSEALHEAVGAEICAAEAPHGAMPIIGVIATGVRSRRGDEAAISVRPNFVRFAHLQRSIFFGTSGFVGADQDIDERRSGAAICALWGDERQRRLLAVRSRDPQEALQRLVELMAFSTAHRLWPSTLSPSNFTVDGETLDHGSFKALPDWSRAIEGLGLPAFGEEIPGLKSLAQSLVSLSRKHLGRAPALGSVHAMIASGYWRAFREEIAVALGARRDAAELELGDLLTVLVAYFRRQQASRSQIWERRRRPWLYAALTGGAGSPAAREAARECEAAILALVARGAISAERAVAVRVALVRFCTPRPALYYKNLRLRSKRAALAFLGGDRDAGQRFVDRMLNDSRRLWRDAPDCVASDAQAAGSYWSALVGGGTAERWLWMEGVVCNGRWFFNGQSISVRELPADITRTGSRAAFKVGLPVDWEPTSIRVGTAVIALPKFVSLPRAVIKLI